MANTAAGTQATRLSSPSGATGMSPSSDSNIQVTTA